MPSTGIVKYHVKLKFEVDGLVEKADIIGAIFGQTEGLLGPEMNLNELQKVSKVGRIEVNVETKGNVAKGDALIPMSTDISTAALIAAAIESIDKVGPFQAKFQLAGIDDIRAIKKKVIVDRAKKIVQDWATKTISESEEMLKDVYDASKPGKLTSYGKAQLACGTGVFDAEWIILVEGRADVINLLRAGYDNAIAIEGARIDETVIKLTEGKKVIAFLDGDRAGDLILKELAGVSQVEDLELYEPAQLKSLAGVEEFHSLAGLHVFLAPDLKDIAPIKTATGLLEFELEGCPRVEFLDPLTGLGDLRFVSVSDCGTIESFRPLGHLHRLEELHAWGTTVVSDGDLTPVAQLPMLREVRMRNRRHYRPRVADLRQD